MLPCDFHKGLGHLLIVLRAGLKELTGDAIGKLLGRLVRDHAIVHVLLGPDNDQSHVLFAVHPDLLEPADQILERPLIVDGVRQQDPVCSAVVGCGGRGLSVEHVCMGTCGHSFEAVLSSSIRHLQPELALVA